MRRTAFILTGLFALLLTVGFSGCNEDPHKPDDLIEESLYLDLMFELFLAGEMPELYGESISTDSLRQVVFDHYDIDQERFERSNEYYQRNPDRQLERIEKVRELLRDEQEALQESRQQYLDEQRDPPDDSGEDPTESETGEEPPVPGSEQRAMPE